MEVVTFFDTEVDSNNKIRDIGGVKGDGSIFHSNSVTDFLTYLNGTAYLCGHNIFKHDLKYLYHTNAEIVKNGYMFIDTLFLSPLLYPQKIYHNLLKDEKLQPEELNNPVNDSIKTKELLLLEVNQFNQLASPLQQIFFHLLGARKEFKAFFKFIKYASTSETDTYSLIKKIFRGKLCSNAPLQQIISENPIELAYSLALINCTDRYAITTPWVIKSFPEVERLMYLLRSRPCVTGCPYCDQILDAGSALKRYFGFDAYRTYGGEALQENAVKAAINQKSLLAIFPTGGGKSITFQVPALLEGETAKGLTVIISPLQSLMKDQVDNLERHGITESVTINGLLDPIERQKSFERVKDGCASILYISPESLRSKSIERILSGRRIARFVIDEAHCFSAWGQDFRVDYQYIGDFIRQLQEKKNLTEKIPVSCFTATAKQKVIEDICAYFKEKLQIDLEIYSANASRTNLHYKVFESQDEEEKYNRLRNLLEEKACPAIVYVSRTKRANKLEQRLRSDGFDALSYHGKMDSREKTENQNAFINGKVQIMVATSAFGMGVDKSDVGAVIHYDISDSLENYVQEAGRAGRDARLKADCYILFNEEDLNKHFVLLNQTKLSLKEIGQIWKAIKIISGSREKFSNSALEIARKAGWDDTVAEIETRVTTAISALEHAGYIQRGQNSPRIFATSILSKNADEAIEKINNSHNFNEPQKVKAIRIIKSLISAKSRKQAADEDAESRIDYMADHLGIVSEEIIRIVNLLKEEKILADTKDLTAFIKKDEKVNRSLSILDQYGKLERYLLSVFDEQKRDYNLKELNENAINVGCHNAELLKVRTILNFFSIKNWIKKSNHRYSKNHLDIRCVIDKDKLLQKQENRLELARFILNHLFEKTSVNVSNKNETLVEFSVHELKNAYQHSASLFKVNISIYDVEDTLYYLSKIEALKIEGGFLVVYNKMQIERLEQNNKIQYKNEDYIYLEDFYKNRIQQIHIVGEYAKTMLRDYNKALTFVDDYFRLNYPVFLNKYFPGSRKKEIQKNMTPAKFKRLFGELSAKQLDIVKDSENQNIVVAAGPGSGKTRVLVHKLASLLLMEEVKHEQLLMLTFSRAATTLFKTRLLDLIGNAAHYIEIKTFHSYCFDLLGRVGTLAKSDRIIKDTCDKIINGDVELNKITKTVLVIDEAQDMNNDEFQLVKTLMKMNEEMRVIAVGDDDQNIYTFRGSNSEYFEQFVKKDNAAKYELVENYRSKQNLVEFTNLFANTISQRFKTIPIIAHSKENGSLRIVEHQSKNMITPLVNDILSTDLAGTTCVLTKTNSEALQISGLLNKNGLHAHLIQSHDAFNLHDLEEIHTFVNILNLKPDKHIIRDESWKDAKRAIKDRYLKSSNFDLCQRILSDFEKTNTKVMYQSDLDVFLRESKLEDFIETKSDTILVSTIHKAKGKEFDNVFIMLNGFDFTEDDRKRELYVGMTRAKNNLSIHLNNSFLKDLRASNMIYQSDSTQYPLPQSITLQLNHHDIYLGYFKYVQKRMSGLLSGNILKISEEGLCNNDGQLALKFSKKFQQQIDSLASKGYRLINAKINSILFWRLKNDDGTEEEVKIILPEVEFEVG